MDADYALDGVWDLLLTANNIPISLNVFEVETYEKEAGIAMLMQAPIAETSTFCVIYIVPFKRWWITKKQTQQENLNTDSQIKPGGFKNRRTKTNEQKEI